VACGDGDDGALPAAVEVFAGPAVGYMEIFVHGVSVSLRDGLGKRGECALSRDSRGAQVVPESLMMKRGRNSFLVDGSSAANLSSNPGTKTIR